MQDFSKRLEVSEDVLIRVVGDEGILLNLNTQQYYSLNPSGMRILEVLKNSASMEEALSRLINEYAVDPAVLRCDLQELVEDMLKQGLIEIA